MKKSLRITLYFLLASQIILSALFIALGNSLSYFSSNLISMFFLGTILLDDFLDNKQA
jgi:hypothetical protein